MALFLMACGTAAGTAPAFAACGFNSVHDYICDVSSTDNDNNTSLNTYEERSLPIGHSRPVYIPGDDAQEQTAYDHTVQDCFNASLSNGNFDNDSCSRANTCIKSKGFGAAFECTHDNNSATIKGSGTCYSDGGTTVFFTDFQDGFGPGSRQHAGCYNYSVNLVPDPTDPDNGGTLLRVINKGNENNMNCTTSWEQSTKHRAEVAYGEQNTADRLALGETYTISERIYIPEDYPVDSSACVIISQIIGGDEGPEAHAMLCGNQLVIQKSSQTESGVIIMHNQPLYQGTFKPGEWLELTFHGVRSYDGTGLFQVYANGNLLVDNVGPNVWATDSDPYFKNGIYWGNDNRDETYTLYFDNVSIEKGGTGVACIK